MKKLQETCLRQLAARPTGLAMPVDKLEATVFGCTVVASARNVLARALICEYFIPYLSCAPLDLASTKPTATSAGSSVLTELLSPSAALTPAADQETPEDESVVLSAAPSAAPTSTTAVAAVAAAQPRVTITSIGELYYRAKDLATALGVLNSGWQEDTVSGTNLGGGPAPTYVAVGDIGTVVADTATLTTPVTRVTFSAAGGVGPKPYNAFAVRLASGRVILINKENTAPALAGSDQVIVNRAGAPMKHGQGIGAYTLYCGRRLGVAVIPGSDGVCGPNNGPQCPDCSAAPPQPAAMKDPKVAAAENSATAAMHMFIFNSRQLQAETDKLQPLVEELGKGKGSAVEGTAY